MFNFKVFWWCFFVFCFFVFCYEIDKKVLYRDNIFMVIFYFLLEYYKDFVIILYSIRKIIKERLR